MASRIQQVAMAVTGTSSVTPWIKHDIYQDPFNVTLSVYLDSVINATLAVQYIADDQSQTSERQVSISQSGTTVTVTDYGPQTNINGAPSNQNWGGPFGHGLLTGDLIWLAGSQSGVDATNSGIAVTVTGADTYTYTAGVSQTLTNVQARVTSGRILTHPSLTALTARATGNYGWPVWMSRLACTAFTSAGKAFLVAIQGR